MKFKLFLLFIVIILAILAYFTLPKVREHYFNNTTKKIEITPQNENPLENNNGDADQDIITNESTKKIDATGTLSNISATDCDNECQNFKDNIKNLTYCREVCGLAPVKNDSDCEIKTGLKKDYCLKDIAIKNKDFKICEEINDTGVKNTCKNRITEEILE